MIDLKLQGGDLVFENGDFKITEGVEELAQSVYIVLQTNTGEWFLNPDMGLDFDVIRQKQPNEEEIRAAIFQALSQEPGIRSIEEVNISFDRKARRLTVNFKATGVNGEQISQEVPINA